MLCFSSRRLPRLLLGLGFLICYTWAFSALTGIYPHMPANSSPQRKDATIERFLGTQFQEGALNDEVSVVQSIIGAKTTEEIDETLRRAFQTTPSPDGPTETIQLNHTTVEQTLHNFPQVSLNVTAAALRRLALVSLKEQQQQVGMNSETQMLQSRLLSSLLETIGSQIVVAQREHQSLSVYALADTLQALTLLSNQDSDDECADNEHDLDQLISLVVELLSRHDYSEVNKLGPIRLVQCLQAMARLGIVATPLQSRIIDRLLKPDAVSKLPAKYISHGLDALAMTLDQTASNEVEEEDIDHDSMSETTLLTRAFMRRLRKQNVRHDATIQDLCRALVATDSIWHCGEMEDLKDEAAIFGFTALRAILEKKQTSSAVLSPSQLANMMSSWATLTNNKKEDTVIGDLLHICQTESILEKSNVWQLERVLTSIQQLHVTSHADTMRVGGERLIELIHTENISPRAFSAILRCPILLHRSNKQVMQPYLTACGRLFLDVDFVARCGVREIANFLWFASMARWRHEGALHRLGQRVLESSLVDRCSPKLASRILATYTAILSLPRENSHSISGDELQQLTQELFHNFGGHLLTSQLSSSEVASSLYAYAKVSYCQDMGIFDHLVSLMANMSSSTTNDPTVRQMTQSLWSCGKMIVYESMDGYGDVENSSEEASTQSGPPYLQNALIIAGELSRKSEELSLVDVTQSIWAMGRLNIRDESILRPLVTRAESLVPRMKAVEISNILWGMAKTGFRNDPLIKQLANRLTSGVVPVSPKEAATAVYALGRLCVADEKVYGDLCRIMMDQIEDTSAQAIANTLWAYRHVHLKPPQELLNSWATQKLGLIGVQCEQISNSDE